MSILGVVFKPAAVFFHPYPMSVMINIIIYEAK